MAFRVLTRIKALTDMLAQHPRLGPAWDERTRAMNVTPYPYRIHYRIDEAGETVEVITIAHTSQRPPDALTT